MKLCSGIDSDYKCHNAGFSVDAGKAEENSPKTNARNRSQLNITSDVWNKLRPEKTYIRFHILQLLRARILYLELYFILNF